MTVPSGRSLPRRALAVLLAFAVLAPLASAMLTGARKRDVLPTIVFVQRNDVPGSGIVPGVGPAGRSIVTGGRLVVRESDGRMHPLVADGRFYDVADPAVSYDGRWVAFAAVTARDSAWRLWVCDAGGRDVRALTRSDRPAAAGPAKFARYDDFDPCWLPDGRVVFASTRYPLLSQQGPVASNLFVVNADGSGLTRITTERQGGEEPSVDPTDGRLLYARWFFNRYRAADNTAGIVAGFEGAMSADTVDLWHAGGIEYDGDHLRLAGGEPRTRTGQQAYQPIMLRDTTFVGVRAERTNLMRSGRLGLQAFAKRFGAARPLFGFGAAQGWSACAPLALPDGRVLFSMDEHGTGNFDLYVCEASGAGLQQVTQAPGTLELDAALLAPRPLPPPPLYGKGWPDPADAAPRTTVDAVRADERTSRFDCFNVFTNADVDAPFPDGLPVQRGLRIRFYTAMPRPDAEGADSLVLLRETPVSPQGGVHVDTAPSDLPMFEQIVDASGKVLRSASGPTHVAGFNWTRPGTGTKCVGCHAGHSAQPVAVSAGDAEWFNAAPSAHATASSSQREGTGPAALVDRRTRGELTQVAWLADTSAAQWVRLQWQEIMETRAVVLYALRGKTKEGGPWRVRRGELVFFQQGREVGRVPVARELSAEGTRFDFPPVRMDALEFRPTVVDGKLRGRPITGLAEITTSSRLAWE
ncbi:MAG: hypothetical protein HZA61_03485 [Candidatus Eisenbacteria bacterium]|uniref:DUF7402 domain-containing protein n=1 Tax=Eiseniibacteriota bacterium TaxID=2212470 RepID=A0A933SC38_UNCEI|nr:hypothetical protein [Candidatus Eisenbacteria bacterium]